MAGVRRERCHGGPSQSPGISDSILPDVDREVLMQQRGRREEYCSSVQLHVHDTTSCTRCAVSIVVWLTGWSSLLADVCIAGELCQGSHPKHNSRDVHLALSIGFRTVLSRPPLPLSSPQRQASPPSRATSPACTQYPYAIFKCANIGSDSDSDSMNEEQIQAKIAALASQINQAKQRQQQIALAANTTYYTHPSRPSHHAREASHWTPYGRGGRAGYRAGFQNRSLVVGSRTGNPVADDARDDSGSDSSAFVSNRRAGTNSIMTKDTFQRQQRQKADYQEPHPPAPKRQDYKDTARDTKLSRTLIIDNIKFEINHDGSKLVRVSGKPHAILTWTETDLTITDPTTVDLETPKKWEQGPVTFLRSKHGNLIKATTPSQRYRQEHGTYPHGHDSPLTFSRPTPKKQCAKFTRYGTYSNQHICPGHAKAEKPRIQLARSMPVRRLCRC